MLQTIYDAIDPVAFHLGSYPVYWYGVLFVFSFACAGFILWRVVRRWELDFTGDDLLGVLLTAIIGAIVGARIGYVCFYGAGYFAANPLKIFALHDGGLSFHGGLVGGLLAGFILARIYKMPFLSLTDLCFIAAPIGICLVRCANFINGELWGAPTDMAWGVVFGGAGGDFPRHPSQLYEAALEGIVLLVVQLLLSRKRPPLPRGTHTGVFLVLYGCFRIMVEFVRVPDAQLGYLLGTGWLTMGMVLSLPLIIAGVCLLIYARKAGKPQMGRMSRPAPVGK